MCVAILHAAAKHIAHNVAVGAAVALAAVSTLAPDRVSGRAVASTPGAETLDVAKHAVVPMVAVVSTT